LISSYHLGSYIISTHTQSAVIKLTVLARMALTTCMTSVDIHSLTKLSWLQTDNSVSFSLFITMKVLLENDSHAMPIKADCFWQTLPE
jgi:hypothetical protein